MNLHLKNCTIISNGKEFTKQITVVDGRIEKILSTDYDVLVDGKTRVIDVKGKHVLPGFIDPHVHFREPGMEEKEDFFSGSKAAVKGGVTTFLDMPNTVPPTVTPQALEEKRELAKKSVANYGFHFGASENIEEIRTVKGVASVKLYMDATTGDLAIKEDKILRQVFLNAKRLSVHAEADNVKKAIDLRKGVLYLCHISLKKEMDVLRKLKSEGIYVEVCPHHLFLTKADENEMNLMKPTLKEETDVDDLWKAISDGIVDTIASDHAPHTVEEKKKGKLYGVPGVETRVPLMLDAVNGGKLGIDRMIELCANNPAKIFGIKERGFLREGYWADLVIVDMGLEQEVEDIMSKSKWSPFMGRKLKGWPIMTIVNGNVVYENKKVNVILGKEVEYE